MLKPLLIFAATLGLLACSPAPSRIELVTLTSDLRLNPAVSTVVVREVSLPSYAAAEELSLQSPEGLIAVNEDVLWADAPERAATLAITRHLNDILSATVGPAPWPFAGIPDVAIEVRIQEMLAGNDGVFTLRGQYFVGGDGIDYPNSARSFVYTSPVNAEVFSSVAAAQANVLLELSENIARSLSR